MVKKIYNKYSASKKCKMIKFKIIKNGNGKGILTQVQENDQIPFKIKRIFYILKTKNKAFRGCHAHKKQSQILICLQGTVTFTVYKSKNVKKRYKLKSPSRGLFIPPKIWVDKIFFGKNAILLVLANGLYNETDYIRNFKNFLSYKKY